MPRRSDPYRFVYLLAAQLGLIVLVPFIAGDRPGPGLFGAFVGTVFVAATWAVARERHIRLVAGLLAMPAIAANLLLVAAPEYGSAKVTVLFGIVFLAFVTVVMVHGVIVSAEVTTETLYGAVAAYLQLGLMWGQSYLLVELFRPGSFRSMTNPDGSPAWPDLMFLSFITLTSVGYGDLIPVSGHARSLAMLEAVTGQMYMAVFIARLVGLHGQRRTPPP